MAIPTQLTIFNGALNLCAERELADLSDEGQALRACLYHWDNGLLGYCLEQGWWKHAMETKTQDPTASAQLAFGYLYGYTWPTDLQNVYMISADERFNVPLLDYYEQGRTWFTDANPIYVRYVSTTKSADYSLWPETYRSYVHHELAVLILPKLSNPKVKLDDLIGWRKTALMNARSKDAMKDPPKFAPESSWNRARRGGPSRRSRTHEA